MSTRTRIKPRIPLLTYIIKIIYFDDSTDFYISRTTNGGKKPSLVLVCVPNGELEDLFEKDIIFNFKTYKYYTAKDGEHFKPIDVPDNVNINKWVETTCTALGYNRTAIPLKNSFKIVYHDAPRNCYWTYTSDNNQKKIRAILRGDTMRLNNDFLKERYDSLGTPWNGYIEFNI